jgi:hypothetical protein
MFKGLSQSVGKFSQTIPGRWAKKGLYETVGMEKWLNPKFREELSGLSGMAKAKTMAKGVGIGGALNLGFTLFSVYQGYKENGIIGAAKGGAEMWAYQTAFNAGKAVLGTASSLSVALPLAAAYGTYKFGQAAGRWGKQMQRTEMGAPVVDQFGTVATMRQKSLAAIQNSHLNSRALLGNEGQIIHRMF